MSLTKVPASMLENADDGELALVPIGTTLDFWGPAAPSANWLFPYGQAVSRATYATLFALLGTRYGVGDGATTFNLPDLRGRVAVGKDNMGGTPANRVTTAVSGVDAATLGAAGGSQLLHQHTHGVTDPGHAHSEVGGVMGVEPGGDNGAASVLGSTGSATTGITIQNAGTGNSQNVQPSIVANVIMRVL